MKLSKKTDNVPKITALANRKEFILYSSHAKALSAPPPVLFAPRTSSGGGRLVQGKARETPLKILGHLVALFVQPTCPTGVSINGDPPGSAGRLRTLPARGSSGSSPAGPRPPPPRRGAAGSKLPCPPPAGRGVSNGAACPGRGHARLAARSRGRARSGQAGRAPTMSLHKRERRGARAPD